MNYSGRQTKARFSGAVPPETKPGKANRTTVSKEPPETILEWSNLSVRAPGKPILQLGFQREEICQVRRGDLLFLRGSSGSGKTTFIRLCLGILQPSLKVNGVLIYYPPLGEPGTQRHDRKNAIPLVLYQTVHWHRFRHLAGLFFGYCPQNPFARFDTRRTLRRQLAEAARLDRWWGNPDLVGIDYIGEPWFQLFRWSLTRERTRELNDDSLVKSRYGRLLTEVNLSTDHLTTDHLGALVHQRSYGFAQRLSMIQIPETLSILFLDEPLNGLDLVTRNRLIRYCVGLLKTEVEAIVCSTHDQYLVDQFTGLMAENGLRTPKTLEFKDRGGLILGGDASTPSTEAVSETVPAPATLLSQNSKASRLGFSPHYFCRHSSGRQLHVYVPEFHIENRQNIIGVTGPSNCGKTSLGKYLCGWSPEGEISRTEQFVPQNPFKSFSPGLPVADSLPDRKDIVRVAETTKRAAEVLPLLDVPPSALSGGQLQRLRILGAFATNPRLLYLDEPFAHQDSTWIKTLSELIRQRSSATENLQIVLVSHNLERLRSLCDYLLLFGEFYFFAGKEAVVLSMPVVVVSPNGDLAVEIQKLIDREEFLQDPPPDAEPRQLLECQRGSLKSTVNQALEVVYARSRYFQRPAEAQKNQAIRRVVEYLIELAKDLGSTAPSAHV